METADENERAPSVCDASLNFFISAQSELEVVRAREGVGREWIIMVIVIVVDGWGIEFRPHASFRRHTNAHPYMHAFTRMVLYVEIDCAFNRNDEGRRCFQQVRSVHKRSGICVCALRVQ